MIFGYTENFYGYILASPVLLKVNLDDLLFSMLETLTCFT